MKGFRFRNIRNVELVHERAAIGARMAATLLDYLVFIAYIGTLMLFPPSRELIRGSGVFVILFYLPLLFYHLLCELFFDGKSVGKYIMGTRVMRTDGSPPTLGDLLLRWVFRLLDGLFGWTVGLLSVILTENGQRIGDLAAGTLVIKEQKRLSIQNIWSTPDPQESVTFMEAAYLDDQEIALLQEGLDRWKKSQTPLRSLIQRIVERLGIRSEMTPDKLAQALIRDHDRLFREGRTV